MEVTCPRCGYRWKYRGKLSRVKCPNCGYTFRISLQARRESSKQEGERVTFVIVPEGEREEFIRVLEKCAEVVGGRLVRKRVGGREGIELDYPDEKEEELRLCLGGYGYGF